jgi:hypothetical protein
MVNGLVVHAGTADLPQRWPLGEGEPEIERHAGRESARSGLSDRKKRIPNRLPEMLEWGVNRRPSIMQLTT